MAFLNNIDRKIAQLGQGAIQRTRELSESMKISEDIRREEEHQRLLYKKMGELYYQMFKNQAEDDFKIWCQKISQSKKRMIELQERLQLIKGMKICPYCNAEIDDDSIFCDNCGKKVVQTRQTEEILLNGDYGKKCLNCGHPLKENQMFCTNCGMKAEEEISKGKPTESEECLEQINSCPNCGNEIKGNQIFCTNCGTKLENYNL